MTYGKLYLDETSRILGITEEELLLQLPDFVTGDPSWTQEVTPEMAMQARYAWREHAHLAVAAWQAHQEEIKHQTENN